MLIVVIKDKWILEQSSTGSSSTICGSTSRHLCEGFNHPSYWIILVVLFRSPFTVVELLNYPR